ncbi:hypothetical protein PIB30_014809 [Stylosanthes scabra]|uniref:Secreted protein n=1 Tax=Stylosanthes scabra TaxID=79078 RepID=A0ABU6Q6T9_9FABA|nr:hypothetical protein [Stylosanthes scabra]
MWMTWLPLVLFDVCLRAVAVGEAAEAGEAAERVETGGNSSHAHEAGPSTRAKPGFPSMNDDILQPGDGYRPEFDGTQFNVVLNEPLSAPSQGFIALCSTLSQHIC